MPISTDRLHALALQGIALQRAELDRLEAELTSKAPPAGPDGAPRKRRYTMTPAQRRATSRRMKAMWAAKKAGK